MATTTNYSWTTPDDTALVKDGAAAIRSLGTAIDSTVFTNAGAAINKTIVDAKGDIIAATAADTVSRLAVGANDTVLTADSSTATGLKWAAPASGGMTLLSTTSLSGASTTISGISGSYTNLQMIIFGVTNPSGNSDFLIAANGGTNNTWQQGVNNGNVVGANGVTIKPCLANIKFNNANNAFAITIFDYANTTRYKPFSSFCIFQASDDSTRATNSAGGIATNSAITSLVFSNADYNLSTGTVLLYGVK